MDCSCLWLKNPKILVESLSTNPEILKNKDTEYGDVIDYKDWQIALSRRFRALKLWIVICRYGSNYLMMHIRSDIKLAQYFESLVRNDKDKHFELVVPRKFALVCFRLKPIGGDGNAIAVNKKLLEAINSSGQAYMTHAVIGGTFAIRCAIGGSLTQKCHIDSLWKLIQNKAKTIFVKYSMDI